MARGVSLGVDAAGGDAESGLADGVTAEGEAVNVCRTAWSDWLAWVSVRPPSTTTVAAEATPIQRTRGGMRLIRMDAPFEPVCDTDVRDSDTAVPSAAAYLRARWL
jgi:hypothetical protein